MARVTIEDCLGQVSNRFKLILLASKRAEQLIKGANPLVDPDGDKPVVLALREIASGLVNERYVESVASGDMFVNSEEKELI